MLKDTTSMNPRGRVKLELYNDEGVFFKKEKKNLVVTDANKIVANMMSDPAKTSRSVQEDAGETNASENEKGLFTFKLSVNPQAVKSASKDVLSTNTDVVVSVQGLQDITKILSVKVGENELVLDQDVFLNDAEAGVLEFAEAPKQPIQVKFQALENKQTQIIAGTEKVKVAGLDWKRGLEPNDEEKVYVANYETGEIYFEKAKSVVEVSYDCLSQYGLGFMALGGKPEGHPDHKPVSFSQSDKSMVRMEKEFDNTRMPVIYPASIEEGKPELELLPTKPIAYEEVVNEILVPEVEEEEEVQTVYELETNSKKLLKLVSVNKINEEEEDTLLVVGEDVLVKSAEEGTIEFVEAVEAEDKFKVVYQLQTSNQHLNYELSLSPIVELVSVVHEHALTNATVAYDIQDKGMKIGSGDVWMMNANAGIMQFSSNPSNGVGVHEPGQLTIEYKVNSGTVVKFVADFPKGVPGPIKMSQTDTFSSTGETTFILKEVVSKDNTGTFEVDTVKRNGSDETFSIHADGTKIDVDNVESGDVITLTYKYTQHAHEVYQVAMFDQKDPVLSKMFNISGIGPVTKNENTGMRITWSVTF